VYEEDIIKMEMVYKGAD